ncbi:MAG TPA: CBS domain-containing protein [Armatimonadota bacterium]|nr:CBS domain-containing protein [Armatimonadota bacterium]HPP74237.1 CBS domain-containing protein [Armatimonadota bacterium]
MFLSEMLGKPVFDVSGELVGKLDDLIVSQTIQFPPVTAAIICTRRGDCQTIPWEQLRITDRGLKLTVNRDAAKSYQIQEKDLLLKRDVQDKQIVDVHNFRVVRVNDVRLEQSDDSLYLVGVDTGMRGLLRRLGLEKLTDRLTRRSRWRPSTRIIAWNDVETFEREEGRLRLKVPAEKLSKRHPADIAKIIEELDPAQRTEYFESVDVETAAETLAETDPAVQVSIVESLDEERAADILEEMEPDEAADVLGDLPADRRDEILNEMEAEEAEDVKELLQYADETAGGLMTTEFISISPDMTAEEIINHLREVGPDAETIYYIYVLDESKRLVGVISLRDLIIAQPQTNAEEFMVENVIHVHLDATIQEIAQTMEDYNLLALPVVDDENRMQGIVTIDDALQKVLPENWRRKIPKVWSE